MVSGILFVIIPVMISNRFYVIKVPLLVKCFDKYAYYIYICHHVFMLGPLSLAHIYTPNIYNIVLMLTLTILTTILLKYISGKVILFLNLR